MERRGGLTTPERLLLGEHRAVRAIGAARYLARVRSVVPRLLATFPPSTIHRRALMTRSAAYVTIPATVRRFQNRQRVADRSIDSASRTALTSSSMLVRNRSWLSKGEDETRRDQKETAETGNEIGTGERRRPTRSRDAGGSMSRLRVRRRTESTVRGRRCATEVAPSRAASG